VVFCSIATQSRHDLKTQVSPMFHVEHRAEHLSHGIISVITYPRESLRMEGLGLTELKEHPGQQAPEHSTEEPIRF
jgi:hypothetical protein